MIRYKEYKEKGFTIIELLIAIAIISILSTAVAVSSQNFRLKAQASQIATELREIQKGFETTSAFYNYDYTYPTEAYLDIGANPGIEYVISNNFLDFVAEDIAPIGFSSGAYLYDFDDDSYIYYDTCPGADSYGGANIHVISIDSEAELFIADELDGIFDGGDGMGCGRIRMVGSLIFYSLSPNT